MKLDKALKMVKERYGLQETYIDEKSGKMIYRLGADHELRAIPAVKFPESGIDLLAPEVKDLSCGVTTIEALVRKKNLELFVGRQ